MSFFNLNLFLASLRYASRGLIKTVRKEQNFRIHFIISIFVLFLAYYFRISSLEFIIILILISLVFILELFNTIFERFVDLLQPRIHHYAREIKDINAAIVLVVALTSLLVGLIIFLPKIFNLF